MILSVCASPCLDITTYQDKAKNCISQPVVTCGGKGLNVAVGVRRLGGNSMLLATMFSKNEQDFANYLASEGVEYSFVSETGEVRKNYKLFDGEKLVEQNSAATAITTQTAKQLLCRVQTLSKRSAVTVLSGSLPQNLSPQFYKSLVDAVDNRSLLIVDASGDNLRQALSAKRAVHFIKPNLDELEQVIGEKVKDITVLKAGCQALLGMGAKAVLVSLGKDGAVITDGGKYYYAKALGKAVNSTVGAGDSMVAAMAAQLKTDNSLQAILKAGVAAGSAKVTDCFTRTNYQRILQNIQVKEI